jgi:serine/threonine protein kinase
MQMKDIVSGLAFLHSIGVLHADQRCTYHVNLFDEQELIRKQPNVLVDADKTARLVDFGISQISSATYTHALICRGTDFYKAPEYDGQISMATEESDIFSLAHLLVDVGLLT